MKDAAGADEHGLQGLEESVTFDSRSLARLDVRVAGRAVSLASVPVPIQPMAAESLGCSGNASLDRFGHARRVAADFQAMRLIRQP
ncbi:MAG: hypothetical protein ACLQU1_27160 [Bryobacteraceae bacterium]